MGDTRGMADCHDSLGLVHFDVEDVKQVRFFLPNSGRLLSQG